MQPAGVREAARPQGRWLELLLARWAEQLAATGFAPRTVEGYRAHLAAFAAYLEAATDVGGVTEITPEVLHAYQTWLYVGPHEKTKRGLAIATQGARLSALRAFCRWLVATDVLIYDPAAALALPKRKGALPRTVLSVEEVARLLAAPDARTPLGLRDRAMLEVLYATGLRNAELRALDVYDVELELGLVRVVAGKNAKDRVVPLGEAAGSWVREYLTEARPRLLAGRTAARSAVPRAGRTAARTVARGAAGEEERTLFVSKSGRRLLPLGVIEPVRRHAQAAGIPRPVTPHALRHTFATHLLAGGADIRHIQAMLGHASVATTQIYTRVEIADLKAVHRRCHPRASRTPFSGASQASRTPSSEVPSAPPSGPPRRTP